MGSTFGKLWSHFASGVLLCLLQNAQTPLGAHSVPIQVDHSSSLSAELKN